MEEGRLNSHCNDSCSREESGFKFDSSEVIGSGRLCQNLVG